MSGLQRKQKQSNKLTHMNGAAPLDIDLGSIDTSMPLLKAEEYYDFVIKKAEVRDTARGGEMIHVELSTVNPATDMKGASLGAGIMVFDNVNCKAGPGAKPAAAEMAVKNTASLVQAAGFTGYQAFGKTAKEQLAAARQWAPQLNGLTLRARVGYEGPGTSPSGKSFKEKNVITLYVKK